MDLGSKKESTFMVSENELIDDRSRLTVFLQVLGRKIWKMMGLNLLTVLFSLPAIVFVFFLSMYLMQLLTPIDLASGDAQSVIGFLFIGYLPLLLLTLSIPIVTTGPAQAGLAFVLRNWTYENPIFLWHDFVDQAKKNFKQSMIVGTLNSLAFVFVMADIYLYPRIAQNNLFLSIASGLLIMVFLIFVMMCLYIWPMMVTYRLTIKHLYKNALLFALGRFLPNLLALVLALLAAYGPFIIASFSSTILAFVLAYLYQLLLGLTLPGLILHAFINPIMDKFMQPELQQDEIVIKS